MSDFISEEFEVEFKDLYLEKKLNDLEIKLECYRDFKLSSPITAEIFIDIEKLCNKKNEYEEFEVLNNLYQSKNRREKFDRELTRWLDNHQKNVSLGEVEKETRIKEIEKIKNVNKEFFKSIIT